MPTERKNVTNLHPAPSFRLDLEAIRARAREHIKAGAVTDSYGADRLRVLSVRRAA